MHYTQSAEQSAELLRLILPRIGQHGGHYCPPSYTVWYEHLAGINPSLSEALEARLRLAPALGQTEIDALFANHVQSRNSRNVVQLQAGLGELLRKLGLAADKSGEQTTEYFRALSDCEKSIGSTNDAQSLRGLVKLLLSSTAAARANAEALRTEVQEARGQIESLYKQLDTLQGEALTDPLTGLRNRRGFDRACQELGEMRANGLLGAALLLVDVDHFKKINDIYGHLCGDQVLRAAARIIADTVKGRDLAARFGGDEFLILLPDTPSDGAMALAEQIRTAFSRVRIQRNGSDSAIEPVSVSIGVAIPSAGEEMHDVLDRADKTLYQAKAAGRNCIRITHDGTSALTRSQIRRTTQ
jgi:diguanylate cyclase